MRILSRILTIALVLSLACSIAFPAQAAADLPDCQLDAEIAVYGVQDESYKFSCGNTAALSQLADGEYYSYILNLRYTGEQPTVFQQLSVSIDGSEKFGWGDFTLQPDQGVRLHVYHVNMEQRMTEGYHIVSWYLGDQVLYEEVLTFTAEPPARAFAGFRTPTADEIAAHNSTATMRSPYLYGRLAVNKEMLFTEYSIDFKAKKLPEQTYLCLANMRMNLKPLEKMYSNVHTEYDSVNMYAGFQRIGDEYVSILSFWDIFYTDENGQQQTLRAECVYPADHSGTEPFGGEGTGIHTLIPYAWEKDHWYRMLLQCGVSEAGTTTVEQWVQDLESGAWQLLCKYDTGMKGSCFTGPVSFFLENFDPRCSGDVRTMQVKNIRLMDPFTGSWRAVTTAGMGSNGGLPDYEGSYAYGADGDTFWMITSGTGGDWYGQEIFPTYQLFTVNSVDVSSPY